jgi:3-keto-5-aminohexanoate cleavage enzyme
MEGCPLPWSVAVMGGDVVESPVGRMAVERGGHLHVGLEDWVGGGGSTNVDAVKGAISLCGEVGRSVASHSQTIDLLALPDPPA